MTDETKQVLEVVKEMFEALNAKIDGLGTETKEIKTHVAKIETTLENDTNKKIQLLADICHMHVHSPALSIKIHAPKHI